MYMCVWCALALLSLTRGDLLLAYVNTKRLYGLCRRINSWCGALSPAGEMRDDACCFKYSLWGATSSVVQMMCFWTKGRCSPASLLYLLL